MAGDVGFDPLGLSAIDIDFSEVCRMKVYHGLVLFSCVSLPRVVLSCSGLRGRFILISYSFRLYLLDDFDLVSSDGMPATTAPCLAGDKYS